jgi:hypothetical protein
MNDVWGGFVTIGVAVLALATLAVIVSKNADTANVVGSLASGLAEDINAATGPVSGGGFGTNILGGNSITRGGGYNNPY